MRRGVPGLGGPRKIAVRAAGPVQSPMQNAPSWRLTFCLSAWRFLPFAARPARRLQNRLSAGRRPGGGPGRRNAPARGSRSVNGSCGSDIRRMDGSSSHQLWIFCRAVRTFFPIFQGAAPWRAAAALRPVRGVALDRHAYPLRRCFRRRTSPLPTPRDRKPTAESSLPKAHCRKHASCGDCALHSDRDAGVQARRQARERVQVRERTGRSPQIAQPPIEVSLHAMWEEAVMEGAMRTGEPVEIETLRRDVLAPKNVNEKRQRKTST